MAPGVNPTKRPKSGLIQYADPCRATKQLTCRSLQSTSGKDWKASDIELTSYPIHCARRLPQVSY